MGSESVSKKHRRNERAVRRQLEAMGIAERARAAFLGLRREDIQGEIQNTYHEAPEPKPFLLDVARDVLLKHHYDLDGLSITAKFEAGRMMMVDGELQQTPPVAVLTADASPEAIETARKAAGVSLPPKFTRSVAALN